MEKIISSLESGWGISSVHWEFQWHNHLLNNLFKRFPRLEQLALSYNWVYQIHAGFRFTKFMNLVAIGTCFYSEILMFKLRQSIKAANKQPSAHV